MFRHKHFVWGWLAIFFYVGSEGDGWQHLDQLSEGSRRDGNAGGKTSAKFLSFYWGGTMIGRLMGAISLSNVRST